MIAGSLVLLLVSYQLAFKETLNSWQINRQLTEQVEGMDNLSDQPGLTGRKYSNLEKILDQYRVDTARFKANLVTNLSILAEKNDVRLTGVPEPNLNGFYNHLKINLIVLQGPYYNLVKFLYSTEDRVSIGRIRSVKINKTNAQDSEVSNLEMTVYFIGI